MRKLPLLLVAAAVPAYAFAGTVTRDADTDNLNLGTAWVGDTAPTASDIATWDSSGTLANTVGAAVTWGGLDISAASGAVSIGSSTFTATYGALALGANDLSLTGTSASNIRFSSLSGSGTLTLNSGATALNTGILQGGADALNFTGTLVLRGGTATTAANTVSGQWLALGQLGGSSALTQASGTAFALDTGASTSNAKDIIFDGSVWNGKTVNLTSLTGFGSIRSDSGTGNSTYTLSVNQATNTTFNGLILSHTSGTGIVRSLNFIKDGVGTLTLAGLVGKETASAGAANADIGITVNGGALVMTASNTMSGSLTVNNGGLLRMESTGGGTGFTGGNASMTANYVVNAGGELQAFRNGAAAFGTGSITLNGGSLYQTSGNWTWTNAITLGDATSSIIGNKSGSGSARALKLQGVIGGSGDVTFRDATGFTTADTGIILTGANTLSGTVTVDTFVRVGGVTGNDSSLAAGTGGTLGTAAVTINSGKRLTFSHSDAVTVDNTISGAGAVFVGSTGVSGSNTQVLTLAGSNSHTGGTTVATGTLVTGNTVALGSGTVNVASGATLKIGDGTTNTVSLGSGANLVLADGATLAFASASDNAIALDGGSATLGSVSGITLDLGDLFNAEGSYHLITGGTVTTNGYTLTHFDTANYSAVFANGTLIVTTAVPEPSTYGLLGAGALAALAFVRRRRR